MKPAIWTLIPAALLLLGGCNAVEIKKINSEVNNQHDEASKLAAQAQNTKPISSKPNASIERVNGLWLPSKKLAADPVKEMNPALKRKITVNRAFTNIEDVAERVTILTGIPATVAPDAAGAMGQNMIGTSRPGMPGMAGMPGQTGMPAMPMSGMATPGQIVPPIGGVVSTPQQSMMAMVETMKPVNLVYNGTVAGFLDVVASRYSVYWEWNSNAIRFFRLASKSFRLTALPGDTTLSATVSAQSNNQAGGGGGGGGGGASGGAGGSTMTSNNNQASGVSFSGLSVWKGVEDSIKTMLTPQGKVVVTPATGTITVTDNPKVLAMVERFVEQQNHALGRQVAVNVRVLAVKLENSDHYGINWEAVYNDVSRSLGVGFASTAGSLIEGTAALTISSIGTDSRWAGSKAVINALSKQGRVSQVTSASVTTLNNQPAPLQVGKQTSYLASSDTTTAGQGVTTTSLQPGTITTGFSMNLVPHILDDSKLLLQYAVNLSELNGEIKTFTSGTNNIQIPEVSSRNFLQRVSLNSGDTLVVAGFEKTDLSSEQQGVGDAENVALGGGHKGVREKTVIVVLLQPVIAN